IMMHGPSALKRPLWSQASHIGRASPSMITFDVPSVMSLSLAAQNPKRPNGPAISPPFWFQVSPCVAVASPNQLPTVLPDGATPVNGIKLMQLLLFGGS